MSAALLRVGAASAARRLPGVLLRLAAGRFACSVGSCGSGVAGWVWLKSETMFRFLAMKTSSIGSRTKEHVHGRFVAVCCSARDLVLGKGLEPSLLITDKPVKAAVINVSFHSYIKCIKEKYMHVSSWAKLHWLWYF